MNWMTKDHEWHAKSAKRNNNDKNKYIKQTIKMITMIEGNGKGTEIDGI